MDEETRKRLDLLEINLAKILEELIVIKEAIHNIESRISMQEISEDV